MNRWVLLVLAFLTLLGVRPLFSKPQYKWVSYSSEVQMQSAHGHGVTYHLILPPSLSQPVTVSISREKLLEDFQAALKPSPYKRVPVQNVVPDYYETPQGLPTTEASGKVIPTPYTFASF